MSGQSRAFERSSCASRALTPAFTMRSSGRLRRARWRYTSTSVSGFFGGAIGSSGDVERGWRVDADEEPERGGRHALALVDLAEARLDLHLVGLHAQDVGFVEVVVTFGLLHRVVELALRELEQVPRVVRELETEVRAAYIVTDEDARLVDVGERDVDGGGGGGGRRGDLPERPDRDHAFDADAPGGAELRADGDVAVGRVDAGAADFGDEGGAARDGPLRPGDPGDLVELRVSLCESILRLTDGRRARVGEREALRQVVDSAFRFFRFLWSGDRRRDARGRGAARSRGVERRHDRGRADRRGRRGSPDGRELRRRDSGRHPAAGEGLVRREGPLCVHDARAEERGKRRDHKRTSHARSPTTATRPRHAGIPRGMRRFVLALSMTLSVTFGCKGEPVGEAAPLDAAPPDSPADDGVEVDGAVDVASDETAGACPTGTLLVPGGSFVFGGVTGIGIATTIETLCVDTTEVKASDYFECTSKGPCSNVGLDCESGGTFRSAGHESEPVNCVTASQAEAYCTWRKKRIPTDAELEFFATGGASGDVNPYPWGGAAPAGQLCWSGVTKRDRACNVGSFPPGTLALFDSVGNAAEWARRQDAGGWVTRGGSWASTDATDVSSGSTVDVEPGERHDSVGFRCVVAP